MFLEMMRYTAAANAPLSCEASCTSCPLLELVIKNDWWHNTSRQPHQQQSHTFVHTSLGAHLTIGVRIAHVDTNHALTRRSTTDLKEGVRVHRLVSHFY